MPKFKKTSWIVHDNDARVGTTSPWNDIQKHSRYVSSWEDNIVVIDVSHESARTVTHQAFDLTKIVIPRIGQVAIDGSCHYRLADFPQLLTSLKAALNSTLFARTSGVAVHIAYYITHATRLFGWMLSQGHYSMESLSRRDTRLLRDNFKKGGWSALLQFQPALSAVLQLVVENPDIGKSLVGRSHDKYMTIRTRLLSTMIGMPCSRNDVPKWFARKLAKLVNSSKPPRRRTPIAALGKIAYARFMGDMNRFADFPTSLGGMVFVPYPNASADASAAYSSPGGRTANIKINDAVKILSEALRWMRDYSPIILEVAASTRLCLEQEVGREHKGHRAVRNHVRIKYQEVISRLGVTLPGYPSLELADLNKCISTLQVACFCMAASNHGRRKNELVGRDVPFGLYFGCVRTISNVYEDTRIDIYVEKSVREYVSFWCNSLVREAVQCLEQLSQLFRPLHAPLKEYPAVQQAGRDDKLFQRRSFTAVGFADTPESFDFASKSKMFFELAEVDIGYMSERTHPFRRIFGLLFKYRYDRYRIAALGQHYGHEFSSVTEVYLTDAPGTSPADGVEALFAEGFDRELSGFKKVMDEVSEEYLEEILLRLLKGELVGGIFARMVLKLMQRFSSDVDYRSQSDEDKANQLSNQLKRRGYSTAENEHGICCATSRSRTKARSNCYKDGMIHPENASPEVCSSCLHLLTTPGYRKGLLVELEELQVLASDFSLSPVARMRYKKEAQKLEDYIEADIRVASSNQWALQKIENQWKKIFFDEVK